MGIYWLVVSLFSMAVHLSCGSTVPSSTSPTLFVSLPSTSFVQGTVLSTIESRGPTPNFELLFQQGCPEDTFTIGQSSGELSLVKNIMFSEESVDPQCRTNTQGDYFVSIKTYYCSVIEDNSYGIPVVINVIPVLESTQLIFPAAFYRATVVEGVANATVSVTTDNTPLVTQTLPVNGLLNPQYRIIGVYTDNFTVISDRATCQMYPTILTTQALTRTQQSTFEVTLEAYVDTHSTTTIVRIEVLDINDESPQLIDPPSMLTVRENTLQGIEFEQLTAIDNDSGLNADVRFSISTVPSPFTIHPLTGQLSSYTPLDFEQVESTEVSISASDLGHPILSTCTNITIFTSDANELPPAVTVHNREQLNVSESAPLGTEVTTFEVTDSDSSEINVTLTNLQPANFFGVEPIGENQYRVVVSLELDFETAPNNLYTFVITATDNGGLSTDTRVEVAVLDENEPPSFTQSVYEVNVREGIPPGSVVFQLAAVDPDSGMFSVLTCSLSSTSPLAPLFDIDTETGNVFTTMEIDYEVLSSRTGTFEAVAADVTLSTTAMLTVYILDENDNAPTFPVSMVNISLPESHESSTPIHLFSVDDLDSGCNGAVQFSILHAEPSIFQIDSFSGYLYLKDDAVLDFNAFESARVVVRATDLGDRWSFSTESTLNISIVQANTNAPVLDTIACPCLIREGEPSGQECFPLSANDVDSPTLEFIILSGTGGQFTIDPITGIVRSISVLEYEDQSEYDLEITVSDGSLSSESQTLKVLVVDINDSPPVYMTNMINIVAPVDTEINDYVGSVTAAQEDAGFNGLTNHQFHPITQQSVRDALKLDPLSGRLYAKQAPLSSVPDFTVQATDLLDGQQSSVSVRITLSGMKNTPPYFATSREQFTVASQLHLTVPKQIATLTAMDDDTGDNSILMYSLVQDSGNHSDLFAVSSSGAITSVSSFMLLASNSYILNVSVSDGGSPSFTAYQEVIISIYDSVINIGQTQLVYSPSASPCHYTGMTQELMNLGGSTGISIPTMQQGQPSSISIIASEFSSAFEFVEVQQLQEVQLFTRGGFGSSAFEGREAIFLTIQAVYGNNFHQCSVTIRIEDTNNHAPQFEEESYSFEVFEGTPIGSSVFQVSATDEDVGSNARVQMYRISTQSVPFSIDLSTGAIEVDGDLDEPTYTLTVQAVDDMSSPADGMRTSTATVQITVLETVNRAPSLMTSTLQTNFTIAEDSRERVTSLEVSDSLDRGRFSMNSLCIASGNIQDVFFITPGGDLSVNTNLDFESQPSTFNVVVMAYDTTVNPASTTLEITINVLDENDAIPMFTTPVYTAVIVESAAMSSPVITVHADDSDAGLNGEVTYSLQSSVFSVNSQSGVITTTSLLDREAAPSYTLVVTARDQGSQAKSSQATVIVEILDINDNAPRFVTLTMPVSFPEDSSIGTPLFTLEASDADAGANGEVVYNIVSGNEDFVFHLNPWTGALTLATEVDHETTTSYQLTFEVRDLGIVPRVAASTLTIMFNVADVNDNYPVFGSQVYECSITEGSGSFNPGCQVNAVDGDSTGSFVSYSLLDTNVPFMVNSNNGLITRTGVIDRETNSQFILGVQAVDSGNPPKTSLAIVEVSVVDTADTVPNFDPTTTLFVPENLPFNSLLFYAHANDDDLESNFTDISYSMLVDNELFRLDEQTGAVFLNGTIDFESEETHSIQVVAENPSVTQTSQLYSVNVININENLLPPVFEESDNPSVVTTPRDTAVDTDIATLVAKDPGPQSPTSSITYYAIGGSAYGYFKIDNSTGVVSTAFSLRGIEERTVVLEIVAFDGGSQPLSSKAVLVIEILPATDSIPYFITPVFTADLTETIDSGHIIISVRAEVDGYYDQAVCYSISTGNGDGFFSINTTTGAISSVVGPGSFEEGLTYSLTVSASKPTLTGTSNALVLINFSGSNTFTPEFRSEGYDLSLVETYPVDSTMPFVRVFARDDNLGDNGRLTYTLENEFSLPFGISATTGDLFLTSQLNRATAPSYTVTVSVEDNGIPMRDQSTTLTITVVSAPGASVPTPAYQSETVEISEGAIVDFSTLTTLTPVSAITHTLIYRIRDNPAEFTISPNTGELYLTAPLDFESTPMYTLTVEVWDGTTGNPVTTTTIEVDVTNVNDNRPEFTLPIITGTVTEQMSSSTVVILDATDNDSGLDETLSYSIVDALYPDSMSQFTLTNGILMANADTDREEIPVHVLTVAVQDNGGLINYARVMINLVDVNDHDPEFPFPVQSIYVPEDAANGSVVHTVATFDPDTGQNAQNVYSRQPEDVPFDILATTGEIVVTDVLDAEVQAEYTIQVTAQNINLGGSTQVFIQINLIDLLDSTPILPNVTTATVQENLRSRTEVASFYDPTNTRPVYYSITTGNDLGNFFIEPLTGTLRTSTPLDREAQPEYELTIQGSFNKELISDLSIRVIVGDKNDNAPQFQSDIISLSIPENTPLMVPMFDLNIDDPDEGANAAFSCLVGDGLAAQFFSVDMSGQLMLLKPLNRDIFDSIVFDLFCFDTGTPVQYSRVQVQVNVVDSNNNVPQFEQSTYIFTLSTPVVADIPVFMVRATDRDLGAFGEIEYSIQGGNGTETFAISSSTGEISVSNNFDLQSEYQLLVTASDGGGFSSPTVTVVILNKECGFRKLQFNPDFISIEITENLPMNSIIIRSEELGLLEFDQQSSYQYTITQSVIDVDPDNGQVFVEGELDRETREVHQLVLQARDRSDSERIAQLDIEITLLDVNDNAPMFTPPPSPRYVAFVRNNETAGHEVFRVQASDRDKGLNAQLTYSLTDDPSGSFAIDNVTGVISLSASIVNSQLDSIVTLTVQATDSGAIPLSNSAMIDIHIVDSNAPRFTMEVYNASIREDANNSDILITVLANSVTPDITYRFDDDNLPFEIGRRDGVVRVIDPGLDFEMRQFYYLTLVAEDSSTSSLLSGRARLDITVLDVNDNSPIFGQRIYTAQEREDIDVPSTILEVSATDLDSIPNAGITYEVVGDEFSDIFNLDPGSGVITVVDSLDFEQFPVYQFNIVAVDSGVPQQTGTATVRIGVENVNDNPPVFTQTTYTASVLESAGPGENLGLFVVAEDEDNLEQPVYSIVPDTPGFDNFTVTSDGLLLLNQQSVSLTQVSYEVNVSAFDGIFFGYTTVVVQVQDSNDNSPIFNQSTYTASVVENGGDQFIVQVFATDADQGTNAEITYSIGSNSFTVFGIDPESGSISTVSNIDRETNPSYAFTVVARDGGGRTGFASVVVMVDDVNDNPPVFTQSMYEGSVVEGSVEGTHVATISATDNDIGENAQLVYTLIGIDNQFPFTIDSTGDISVGPFPPDFNTQNLYEFNVSVRDSGNLTAATVANVSIDVTEANDNTPELASPLFVRIAEDVSTDTVVVELEVTNSSCLNMQTIQTEPVFFLLSSPEYFALNDAGQIITRSAPLPVGNTTLLVRFLCLGASSVVALQGVTVEVVDINNPPTLVIASGAVRGYESSIPEDESEPSFLTINALNRFGVLVPNVAIEGQDDDDGINGTFMFRLRDVPQKDGEDLFEIDSNTGLLFLNGPLDFDFGPQSYIFRVEVVDGGTPPLSDSESIVVTVLDVNDIPPDFVEESYTIQVPEDQQPNSVFFTIQAVDNDTAPENRNITYQITGSEFQIDGTGGIFSTIALDRETRSMYEQTAIADDGEQSDTVPVFIVVTDVNDEPPVFNQTLYSITLVEEYPTDTVFLQVFTTDGDEGDNAQASFSIIEQPPDDIVTIDNVTGEISFLVSPDYEVSPQLELQVGAVDVGNSVLTAVVTVAITLQDINDNSPSFTETSYSAEILENLPAGTRVRRVEATDPDSVDNAVVSYTLSEESEEIFSITNGVITTKTPFDREMNSSIEILVIATDSGDPSRSSNATIQVTILDENDQQPEFDSEVYNVQISEFEPANFEFLTVRAVDGDEGTNARIDYSLSGDGSSEFLVQTLPNGNASLALENELNFERRSSYNLTLRAIDGGFPLMEDTAILLIEVIDENDNDPVFAQFSYERSLPEDASTGLFILSVNATDRDVSDVLVYTIQNAATYPEFSINSTTGDLFVASSLDYETSPEYNLIVIAADQTDSPRSASAAVSVTLIDVNDNVPHFLPHNNTQSIVENSEPRTLVTLEANDIDSVSLQGQITFSISSGNLGNVLEIGPVSGILRVTETLDREDVASYLLTISATDNGSPSLTGFTNITVIVEDQNDNAPTGGHQDIYLYLLNGRAPMISLGQVFVNDSDVVNQHTYTVLNNPTESSLRILDDGTIEINSEIPASSNITVMIQDGTTGTALTTISSVIRNITSESLVNSFGMQVAGTSPQSFVDNTLGSFLTVATSVLVNGLQNVSDPREIDFQVFSIQESSSLPTNLDLFILVADTVNGGFIHPNLVQHLLHINRRMIEEELNIMIQTEFVDLCSSEICSSDLLCSNSFEYSSTDSISFGSRSITYLGLATEHSTFCQQLQPRPCEMLADCNEPAFCIESNKDSIAVCQDSCNPNPCKNGGSCQPQSPGYYCVCPPGFDGRNCERTGATFTGSSYAILPSITTLQRGTISLEVSTSRNDGLLFYIGRFDGDYGDFIAVELVGGLPSVLVSYGLKEDRVRLTLQLPNTGTLSDLLWHQLTINYTPTIVTLTLTTYDPFTVETSNATIRGNFRYLDLGGPLIFGSLPQTFGYSEVTFQPFTGCLRNVRVNDKLVDFSNTLAELNLMGGCVFADMQCDNNPCNNGGRCVGIWGSHYCSCTGAFMGTSCSQASLTASFSGLNFIQYEIKTITSIRPLRQVSTYTTGQNEIQLSLIAAQPSGVILQLGDITDSQEYLMLEIVDGNLQVRYNLGSGEAVLQQNTIQVDDEQTHSVTITRTEREVTIVIDGQYVNRTTSPGSDSTLDVPADAMYLGAGVHPENGSAVNGFLGCVSGFSLDRRVVPIGGENEGFVTLVFSDSIGGGCPFGGLFEEPQPDVQVYAVIAAILVVLLLISACFVATCMISRWVRRRRSGEHTVNLRRNSTRRSWNFRGAGSSSPTQEGFQWQPSTMYKHDLTSPPGAYRSTPQHVPEPTFNFNMNNRNPSPSHSVPGTDVRGDVTETAFNDRRSSSMRSQQRLRVHQPQEGFAFNQPNQGYRDDIDLGISDTETTQPQHIRSFSGQQSILSVSTAATSNFQEDTEVSKYLGKRLEIAHSEIVEQNYDEMKHYKEEGHFQPMGSIGSLLDFVKELDSGYKQDRKEMYQFPSDTPAASRDATINARSEQQPQRPRIGSDLHKSRKKTSPLTGQRFEEGTESKPKEQSNPSSANERKAKTRRVVRRDSHSKRMENILERFHNHTTGYKPDEGRLI